MQNFLIALIHNFWISKFPQIHPPHVVWNIQIIKFMIVRILDCVTRTHTPLESPVLTYSFAQETL